MSGGIVHLVLSGPLILALPVAALARGFAFCVRAPSVPGAP